MAVSFPGCAFVAVLRTWRSRPSPQQALPSKGPGLSRTARSTGKRVPSAQGEPVAALGLEEVHLLGHDVGGLNDAAREQLDALEAGRLDVARRSRSCAAARAIASRRPGTCPRSTRQSRSYVPSGALKVLKERPRHIPRSVSAALVSLGAPAPLAASYGLVARSWPMVVWGAECPDSTTVEPSSGSHTRARDSSKSSMEATGSQNSDGAGEQQVAREHDRRDGPTSRAGLKVTTP